jgi:hypothetical protein
MQRKRPDVDVVKDILEAVLKAQPHSVFVLSLNHQYQERGGLSKRQLAGLLKIASKIKDIQPAKLATLEAVVLRKPTRYKSAPPPPKPLFQKNEQHGAMIEAILQKFPQHKQLLLLKRKYDQHEPFSPADENDLNKFYKLLVK